MGREFWRTIRLAIEKDNWTARLVVLLCITGAVLFDTYAIGCEVARADASSDMPSPGAAKSSVQ
ncbi:hypothetical protein ACIHCV_40255 [Streptomyces sp. NPDC051956]|uniref:hypothetical protein n=1 Tax=Streptomyces sp. NPDC051956 TaxID=3365677 RepID=UPI0037D41428